MNSTPETRYSLIGKLWNPQDADAWSEFTAIYQPLILRICRKRGLQHADATDVTQEVLAKVAEKIQQFDHNRPGATFRGWLYRVTRNLVIDFFRKENKLNTVQPKSDFLQSVSPEKDMNEKMFREEFQRQVFWIVARKVRSQVEPNTWLAFWETEMEQKPVAGVARRLGMTAGAIYVSRSRILARMKNEVERRLENMIDNKDEVAR